LLAGGFAPQLVPVAPAEWERNFLAGDFESTVFEVGGLDTPDVGLRLHTKGGIDGRFSLWGYSNPLYDSAVREALSALNPAERAVRSRDAQRMLLDDVPGMFPVAAPVEQAYLSPRLLGYEFDAYDFNAAWLASGWQMRDAGA
jgi:ABC-type transport system substrate-binding protein